MVEQGDGGAEREEVEKDKRSKR
jgi:hypothetical protein